MFPKNFFVLFCNKRRYKKKEVAQFFQFHKLSHELTLFLIDLATAQPWLDYVRGILVNKVALFWTSVGPHVLCE